jgi:hypothetical protein
LRYTEIAIGKTLYQSGRLKDVSPEAAFTALREWKNNF